MHLSIETGAIVQVLFRFENNCPSIDTIHVFNLIHYTYVCTIIITIYAILFLDPNWNHVLIEQNKWFELSAKTHKKKWKKVVVSKMKLSRRIENCELCREENSISYQTRTFKHFFRFFCNFADDFVIQNPFRCDFDNFISLSLSSDLHVCVIFCGNSAICCCACM